MSLLRDALAFFSSSKHPAPAGPEAITAGLKAIQKGDYQTAYHCLLPEAERGNKLCQGLIGKMYEEGNGATQNYAEAAKWYQRAAAQGYASAQVSLGVLYQKGRGVILNHQEALHWYRAATAQGHAKAMYDIGTLYENGQGVERDLVEAARWYLDSAEHGEMAGAHAVAVLYEAGQGVEENLVEAWAWFSIAANGGFPDAAQLRDALGLRLDAAQMEQARRLRDQRTR